jgi:hypothetical protein
LSEVETEPLLLPIPHPTYPIVDLLIHLGSFRGLDPRDKVYAPLGLGEETSNPDLLPANVRPDYSKKATHVYADLTRFLIGRRGNLKVLSAINIPTQRILDTESYNLPSWVPRFDLGPSAQQMTKAFRNHDGFRAAGDTVAILETLNIRTFYASSA